MSSNLTVVGIGTEVGKTVVSAILCTLLEANYWKPVESGEEKDSERMKDLLNLEKHTIFPPAYSLKAPLSPHHAAQLENLLIQEEKIRLPKTKKKLVIEGVGGILTPLTLSKTALDVMQTWEAEWVVVSRHYLGSINHTLLTLEALKARNLKIKGVIFNGSSNPKSEEAILTLSRVPYLGHLFPETSITPLILNKYAHLWRERVFHDFHN